MLDRKNPIAIIADPARENESAIRLGCIGFDHIAGYLTDGLRSLEARPERVSITECLSAQFAEVFASRYSHTLQLPVQRPARNTHD
jgi:hydroxyacylglutathione hydrolase